jgi:hypothetical protein
MRVLLDREAPGEVLVAVELHDEAVVAIVHLPPEAITFFRRRAPSTTAGRRPGVLHRALTGGGGQMKELRVAGRGDL